MTRTIVIANQKGGVGKTTTAINLGHALVENGYRVLMIDMDPQASLTASVGIDPYELSKSSYSLLMRTSATFNDVVQEIKENFFIVPAANNLTAAEIRLSSNPESVGLLKEDIDRKDFAADFILIDTPPSLGVLSLNGFVAATELLVPVQCTFLGMRGVRETLNTMTQLRKRLNPNLKVLGYLATMFDEINAPVSREVVDELRSVFKEDVFQTVIGRASVLAEAPINGQSVLDYAPQHPAAYAYRALAQEVINRGGK